MSFNERPSQIDVCVKLIAEYYGMCSICGTCAAQKQQSSFSQDSVLASWAKYNDTRV